MSLLDLAYLCGLTLASPVLLWKAITRPKQLARHLSGLRARLGREGAVQRTGGGPCVWVHGVSVGEVAASEPLVRAIERSLPGHEIVITTSTQTGQAVAHRKFAQKQIGYFPVDFSWTVRRTFEAIRPSLVVLVELELWPNFLAEAKHRNVPVVVVNGRISEKSYRGYRLARRFLPLNDVAHYCVQTPQYARRFQKLGVPDEKITVTGSMKYDNVNVLTAEDDGSAARASMGLAAQDVVWIAGSTHWPEERLLVEVFTRLRAERPELRLVLAPRHNERAAEVARMVEAAGLKPVLRSTRGRGEGNTPASIRPDEVLIVDTLGELSRLYAGSDLVFVGGSLIPHGGQNMLEPAALGKPVVFGPHVENFQESADRLLQAQGAIQVKDERELEARLRELLADRPRARALGARALETIEAAKGATERTVAVLKPLLSTVDPVHTEAREQGRNPVPFSPRFT